MSSLSATVVASRQPTSANEAGTSTAASGRAAREREERPELDPEAAAASHSPRRVVDVGRSGTKQAACVGIEAQSFTDASGRAAHELGRRFRHQRSPQNWRARGIGLGQRTIGGELKAPCARGLPTGAARIPNIYTLSHNADGVASA